MRNENSQAKGKATAHSGQYTSIWRRFALVVAIALAFAATIAACSADSPYEDRLVDLALRQAHGPRWNGSASNPGTVKALLLDYDHELAFKAQLAVDKYGDDARDVLLRFGDDPGFQDVIRQYGENTVPVVAYFVKNDIASLRLLYLAQQKSDAAIAAAKGAWDRFWHKGEGPASADDPVPGTAPQTYGPDLRGQRAIALIAQDGHQFLGQFVLDPQGKAAWVQTERTAEAVKSLFLSGTINLEKKYRSGQALDAADALSAGMDVFIFIGAFKALKVLRAAQQVRAVGLMKRTQLLGAPLLGRSALGRHAMKYGVAAGTVYLMARHPSLLSSVFVTLGKWLGISPFLAKTLGWGLLLAPLLLPLLWLTVLALRVSGAMLTGVSNGMQWTLKRLGWRALGAI